VGALMAFAAAMTGTFLSGLLVANAGVLLPSCLWYFC